MIELNDLFDYGYHIYQNSEYFKFSIDSILLAEFVDFKKNQSILDMCTGNAPIPMILTSKDNSLNIDAVEIQKEIYLLGKRSIEKNKLNNINIYNENIKDYQTNKKYDIITCNPPYFKKSEGKLVNTNKIKSIARHEIEINIEEIIIIAKKVLKETGKLYLVHRCERLFEITKILEQQKFGIRRIAFIFTDEKKESEFFLLEASKNKKTDPKITYINIKDRKTYKNIFKEVI